MPRHKRDLLDREASLEQATGPFVTKVMEVKINDAGFFAGAPESGAHRSSIVRKAATLVADLLAMLFKYFKRIIPCDVEKRHPLIIAVLFPWILSVSHENGTRARIEVFPFDAHDLV